MSNESRKYTSSLKKDIFLTQPFILNTFLRFSETVNDPASEADSEKVKWHFQSPLFLFCVFNDYFNEKENQNHACFLILKWYDKAMLKRLLSILTSYKLLYSRHLLLIQYPPTKMMHIIQYKKLFSNASQTHLYTETHYHYKLSEQMYEKQSAILIS